MTLSQKAAEPSQGEACWQKYVTRGESCTFCSWFLLPVLSASCSVMIQEVPATHSCHHAFSSVLGSILSTVSQSNPLLPRVSLVEHLVTASKKVANTLDNHHSWEN